MDGRAGIINQAMLYANQDDILNPEGVSKNAKLCAQFYDATLQEALSSHPWSFALAAAKLQRLNKEPKDFRFKYAYQLPVNFGYIQSATAGAPLIPSDFMPSDTPYIEPSYAATSNTIPIPEYMVQGKEIYSNVENLQIVYSRIDVLPFEMTPTFSNYLSSLLAAKLYLKMTGGLEGLDVLQKNTTRLLNIARHTDSNQTDTVAPNRPNLFIFSRGY